MEQELRSNLSRLIEAYARAKGIAVPTVGRMAAGDWRFFDRLNDDDRTFTIRKYDEVVLNLSSDWPDGVEWPADIPRPDARDRAGAVA